MMPIPLLALSARNVRNATTGKDAILIEHVFIDCPVLDNDDEVVVVILNLIKC